MPHTSVVYNLIFVFSSELLDTSQVFPHCYSSFLLTMHVTFEYSSSGQSDPLIFTLWNCHWIIVSLQIEDIDLFAKHPIIVIWPALTGISLRSLNLTCINSISDMVKLAPCSTQVKISAAGPSLCDGEKALSPLHQVQLCHVFVFLFIPAKGKRLSELLWQMVAGGKQTGTEVKGALHSFTLLPAPSAWEESSIKPGQNWIPKWFASTDSLSVLGETTHCVEVGNISIMLPHFAEFQFWMVAGRAVLWLWWSGRNTKYWCSSCDPLWVTKIVCVMWWI